jgi:translation initiation factor IF-2
MAEVELGRVTHYFGRIGVAAIEITQDSLVVGDTIHVKGHTSDFTQKIDSIQIDGQSVDEATVGQSVGIKVSEHAREHDTVYKVVE